MLTQNPPVCNVIQPHAAASISTGHSNHALLQGIMEGLIDGVLILSEQGEIVQANRFADKICAQINQSRSQSAAVPASIWKICQTLIQSRQTYPNQEFVLESEIGLNETTRLRVRVRWLSLATAANSYLLVILEDQKQAIQNLAIAEIDKYKLTPREAEVWLLYRTHYSYKEIAVALYISCNTVKKHLKNIRSKQRMFDYLQQEIDDRRYG